MCATGDEKNSNAGNGLQSEVTFSGQQKLFKSYYIKTDFTKVKTICKKFGPG